jgi:predicted dehydrogenase
MKPLRRTLAKPLRGAVFGAGFWTRYQLAAWHEVGGVEFVAIYNRTKAKAEAVAREFNIPRVYDDADKLLREVKPDFVDNITEVGGHKPLSLLCARHQVACICQKPMAESLKDARAMVAAFAKTGTPFFVHENWRWQTPMRHLKRVLASGVIGAPIRGRLTMVSGFEGWVNQPALRELDHFILMDLGTHLFDAARWLFGEPRSLYCQTAKTLPTTLKGENVCTALLTMGEALTHVVIEMAYAKTPLERECFPQTLAFVEGPRGSVEIMNDYWIRLTTRKGTHSERLAPPRYAWANPQYDIAHASIVDCHRDLLAALRGESPGETTGADNLKTLELVFGCYQSAAKRRVFHFKQ